MTGANEFRGIFKVLRTTEQTDESERGQENMFRVILRSKTGERIKILSSTPLGWKPGAELVVKIRERGDSDIDEVSHE
jgi:hypothetical protein